MSARYFPASVPPCSLALPSRNVALTCSILWRQVMRDAHATPSRASARWDDASMAFHALSLSAKSQSDACLFLRWLSESAAALADAARRAAHGSAA